MRDFFIVSLDVDVGYFIEYFIILLYIILLFVN